VLGEYKGSQAREVLISLEEYEKLCAQMQADAEASASAPAPEGPAAEQDQHLDHDQDPDEDSSEEAPSEPSYAPHDQELSASGKGN
jgi:hypothetical protein